MAVEAVFVDKPGVRVLSNVAFPCVAEIGVGPTPQPNTATADAVLGVDLCYSPGEKRTQDRARVPRGQVRSASDCFRA